MLRLIITICLFLSIASCHPSRSDHTLDLRQPLDEVHRFVSDDRLRLPHFANTIRSKRQAWNTDDEPTEESTNCILQCANEMKDAIEPFKNNENFASLNTDRIMKPNFNMTRFNDVCSAMRPSIRCFDQCPDSQLKITMASAIDPIRFVCVDRFQDFQNNFRCMRKLDPTTNSQCTPKCRRFEAVLNRTIQFNQRPYMRYLYSASDVKSMLSGTCQYVECFTDCSVALLRTVCGNTAAELVSKSIQKMFASVQTLYTLRNIGDMFPEACRRVASPDRLPIDNQQQEIEPQPRQEPQVEEEDDEEDVIQPDAFRRFDNSRDENRWQRFEGNAAIVQSRNSPQNEGDTILVIAVERSSDEDDDD